MAQTPWFFFRAASSYDDTEADQCSKNNFFWKSHLQEQEQKQKHILDFTFNDLYILKGDFGKGLMKSIERLEQYYQVFDH